MADLYRIHGGAVYARCRRILGDQQAAEDAAQETFLRLHRHLARISDRVEAVRWIYRVATNYCLNQIRDEKKRRLLTERWPQGASHDASELALVEVRDLMLKTPPKLRSVAWLHHVDGLEQQEIAEILGVSRRTVVARLSDFARRARTFSSEVRPRRLCRPSAGALLVSEESLGSGWIS